MIHKNCGFYELRIVTAFAVDLLESPSPGNQKRLLMNCKSLALMTAATLVLGGCPLRERYYVEHRNGNYERYYEGNEGYESHERHERHERYEDD